MRFAVRSEDIQNIVWISERESGEMPERSGHCIQGMRLRRFHCLPRRARRRSRVSICKSGNLLGIWDGLPSKVKHPIGHYSAGVSEMSAMGRQAVFITIMIVCISSILIYTNNTSFLRAEIPHLLFRCKRSSSAVMVLLFCYTKILVTQTFSIMFRNFSCISQKVMIS